MSSFHSTEEHSLIFVQDSPSTSHQGYWQPHEMDQSQFYQSHFPPNKTPYMFDMQPPMHMENGNVQRYLDHPEKPWAAERLYPTAHGHVRTTVPYHAELGRPFDTRIPWPGPDDYQRQVSPASTTLSIASGWSIGREELSPHLKHVPFAYDSPPTSPDHHPLPYGDFHGFTNLSPGFSPGGGEPVVAIAMSDVQGMPDHQEAPMEEDFDTKDLRTEFKHEYYPEHEDSGVGDSLPEAESVHYATEPESCSGDDDYKPNKRRGTLRKLRGSPASNNNSPSRTRRTNGRVNGRVNGHTNGVTAGGAGRKRKRRASHGAKSNGEERPFPCPLKKYGCHSTFSTKNEWKRHVATQHIKLGYWRCDLCPAEYDANDTTEYHNDFNRKDLFSQHLRRMHSSKAKNGGNNQAKNGKPPVTEENLGEHQKRCYHLLRSQPDKSQCLFCPKSFSGKGSWDERMEHVGKHLEGDEALGRDPSQWRRDGVLERYFEEEGLIILEGEEWSLGDGTPVRGEQEDKHEHEHEHPDSDEDADGEEE